MHFARQKKLTLYACIALAFRPAGKDAASRSCRTRSIPVTDVNCGLCSQSSSQDSRLHHFYQVLAKINRRQEERRGRGKWRCAHPAKSGKRQGSRQQAPEVPSSSPHRVQPITQQHSQEAGPKRKVNLHSPPVHIALSPDHYGRRSA